MRPVSGDNTRVNERIRISPVLVISDGENLGIMPTSDAIRIARERGLDLVEVSPNVRPPVCRIIDYGKFKYDKSKKEASQKKSVKGNKQVRLRPVTDKHDLETKIKQINGFLEEGHGVLLTMKFKAREITHKDIGLKIIEQIISETSESGNVLSKASFQGKMLTCVIGPKK